MSLSALWLSPSIMRLMAWTCCRSRLVALTASFLAWAMVSLASAIFIAYIWKRALAACATARLSSAFDGLRDGLVCAVGLGQEAVDGLDVAVGGLWGSRW